MASSAADTMIRNNIEFMNKLDGFSVIIVCTSTPMQAAFWQKRLEDGKGSILPKDAMVLAVDEDWPGGAGNGTSNKEHPFKIYWFYPTPSICQYKSAWDPLCLYKSRKARPSKIRSRHSRRAQERENKCGYVSHCW